MKVFQRLIVPIIAIIFGLMSLTALATGEKSEWDCPECGRSGNTGNFCGGCGHPAPGPESGTNKTSSGASWKTLVNLDFSNWEGFTCWQMDDASVECYLENGMLKLNILKPGSESWSVQVTNTNFQLIQGAEYELSLDMKSSADRDVEVCVQHYGGDWQVYAGEWFHATNTMEHYTWKFTMTEATDKTPQLGFNLGLLDTMPGTAAMKQHQIYIDNIQLKVLE